MNNDSLYFTRNYLCVRDDGQDALSVHVYTATISLAETTESKHVQGYMATISGF